jgi:RHS repeat-associated protein
LNHIPFWTKLLSAISFVLIGASPAFGQADLNVPNPAPFQAVEANGIDHVNLSNDSMQLDIPLVSFKQRGNLSLTFSLRYATPTYTETQTCIPTKPCTYGGYPVPSSVYVSASTDLQLSQAAYVVDNASTGYYWVLLTPDGSSHKLANTGPGTFRSLDASGWTFNENTSVLISRDGTRYAFIGKGGVVGGPAGGNPLQSVSFVEDTNGNRITLQYNGLSASGQSGVFSGWIDSVGRQIAPSYATSFVFGPGSGYPPISSNTSGCTGSLPSIGSYVWTIPGYNGGLETYKFCYASVPLTSCTGPSIGSCTTTEQQNVGYIQSVVLPDVDANATNESWTFEYNGSGTGALTQVTLPEGGTIGYSMGRQETQYCQDLIPNQLSIYPKTYPYVLTSRTLSPVSGPTETWTYGLTNEQVSSNGSRSIVNTVQDLLGQKVVHTFTGLLNTCSYYETQTQYYDASGSLLRTDSSTYSGQKDMDTFPTQYPLAMGVVPASQTVEWAATGATKQTVDTWDKGFTANSFSSTYSYTASASGLPYGQKTSQADYDYGTSSGIPGTVVLRNTSTNFMAPLDEGSLSNNLLDLPSGVGVYDEISGKSLVVSYGYDESSVSSAGASPTTWNSNPLSTKRGNQTSISYDMGLAPALNTTNVYYDTGEIASTKDPLGNTTTFSYSPSYNVSYLTKVTNALGQSTDYAYDLSSGVVTGITDRNSITTSYGYDQAARLTTVTRPGGDHNLAMSIGYSYLDSNDIEKTEQLNSSIQPETDTTTVDGLGRTIQTHHVDPEGDTYVDTTYDVDGRRSTVTTPYRSKSDASFYGITTYSYDAFNRVTNIQNPDKTSSSTLYKGATSLNTAESNSTGQSHTMQKLNKVDGLGRVIGVCEVTSTTLSVGGEAPTSCGMDIAETGFLTSYTQTLAGITNVTQGHQTRTFSYDPVYRLTDATNPESGHIHYAYDGDSDLISKTIPAPNAPPGSTDTVTINYQNYDALHRVGQKTYTAGNGTTSAGDVAASPTVYYLYDQASVDGKTLENPVGRLTSEYTMLNGAVQSKSVYSYDTAGTVSSHFQCVLQNCPTYQDAEYHYDGEENPTQFSTPQNGFSLSYNQAGHLITATPLWTVDANHPAQLIGPVGGKTEYAPNGMWANVAFGNGTAESYSYQPRWLSGMSVSGEAVTSPAVPATATLTVNGSEKSEQVPEGTATAASGQLIVAGSERVNASAQNATATITVGGAEASKQVLTAAATRSTGSVVITGSEGSTESCPEPGHPGGCTRNPDYGTVTIIVDGFTASATYQGGSTQTTVANALATALNTSASPVSATVSSGTSSETILLTSTANGSVTNYSFSSGSSGGIKDFILTSGGEAMTGGQDAQYSTIYDSGTVTVNVNGFVRSVSYGQGSLASSVASSIASAFTCSGGSSAGATASGTALIFTACTSGSAANGYSITSSTSYNTQNFTSPSFTASGAQLAGGKNEVWDAGTLTVTLPSGYAANATFGESSTANSVASALVSALSASGSPVTASLTSAGGSTVQLKTKATGAATDGTVSVSVSGNYSGAADFSASSAGLSGGENAGTATVYDQGTVTLSLNGTNATVPYGQSSTVASLAQTLAAAVNSAGMPVSASVAQGSPTITLTAKLAGTSQNGTTATLSVTSTQSPVFSPPSFSTNSASLTLQGGTNPVMSPEVIYSYSLVHAPDGQIANANDSINGNWNYTYDDFNRLQTASQVGANNTVINGLSWNDDRYGNRWNQNVTAGTGTSTGLLFDPSSNHATTNLVYDAGGNVLKDTLHSYVYDSENRIVQVDQIASYIYDAEGRRVGKSDGTTYVVGLAGQVLDELDSGQWVRSEVYAGGHHLATVTGQTVYFNHTDWLGTERARTDVAGALCETLSSQPFGDSLATGTSTNVSSCNPTPNFLTGKQRDTESNLDDFGARYFSSQWGRWMSPDWAATPQAVPHANLANPQSLNLYAYVNNDPVGGEDPDGHAVYFDEGVEGAPTSGEVNTAQQEAAQESTTPASTTSSSTAGTGQLPQQTNNNSVSVDCNCPTTPKTHWWNTLGSSISSAFKRLWGANNQGVMAATDAAALVAPYAGKAGTLVGPVGSVLNFVNDPTPKSYIENFLPFVVPEMGIPLALYGAADDGSQFVGNQVIIPVFTPDTLQNGVIDNGHGVSIPNPAMMDGSELADPPH